MTEFVCEWKGSGEQLQPHSQAPPLLNAEMVSFLMWAIRSVGRMRVWGFARTPPFGLQMILYTAYLFILNTVIILILRKLKKIIMLWPYIRLDLS